MLEYAESDVVERDAAKGKCTDYGFTPIGYEIKDSDDAEHDDEGQDIS